MCPPHYCPTAAAWLGFSELFIFSVHWNCLTFPHTPKMYSPSVIVELMSHLFIFLQNYIFPCQLSELKTITSYILCQSPAPAGHRNWRGDVGSPAITNTQETYLRRQNLILFSFIFLLILLYYLRQKSLCKKEITSQTQVTYFSKNKIFT